VKRFVLSLVLLVAHCALAQAAPLDFSGVFLRTTLIGEQKHREIAPPRILEVKQATGEITIAVNQGRETAEVHLALDGKKSNGVQARLNGKSLVLKKVLSPKQPGNILGTFTPTIVEEKWQLSPDSQQLTVARKFETPSVRSWTESETYVRQPSMAVARAKAESTASACNQLSDFFTAANAKVKVKKWRYQEGTFLGDTELQSLTRCALYTADLSGKFFKDLEQSAGSNQADFRKSGKIVSTFADDVVLEVEPTTDICSQVGIWAQPRTEATDEVRDLRFMVRWMGPEVQDLGEVKSEFLNEPWAELQRPRVFYRMQIPAKGIPLSDDLEVLIFSKGGEQLGCVKGHI
jgi:hypothetical protein